MTLPFRQKTLLLKPLPMYGNGSGGVLGFFGAPPLKASVCNFYQNCSFSCTLSLNPQLYCGILIHSRTAIFGSNEGP